MLPKLWWSLSSMTRNWRRWILSFPWLERWGQWDINPTAETIAVDGVCGLRFVYPPKNRQVGGAYGIASTMFFALYLLLWNLEYAKLGRLQVRLVSLVPATVVGPRASRVQRIGNIGTSTESWVILWTFMDHFEIGKKNAKMFRNVLSFDCLPKKVLIFHRTLRYTSGDPLGVCLRNNHRHDASLPTGVNVVKQKEDKVATPAPKAVASWKDHRR